LEQFENLVKAYESDVSNPELSIVHNIRTVYGRGDKEGTIGEEKDILHEIRSVISHTLPLKSIRLHPAQRRIGEDDTLWVRQHLNWLRIDDANSKEHYLFQPLKRDGVDKCRFMISPIRQMVTSGGLALRGNAKAMVCRGP